MNLAALTISQQQALNALKDLDRHCSHTPERLASMLTAAKQNKAAADAILATLEAHDKGFPD